MSNVERPSRLATAFRWTRKNAEGAATVAVALALIVLSIIQIFGSQLPFGWFVSGVAILASLSAVVVLLVHHGQRRAAADVESLRGTLDSVQGEVQRLLPSEWMHEVAPHRIDDELALLLESATQWSFRGASARWQRGAVLPRLAKIKDRNVAYRAQVLNPFDDDLCQKYAEYRSSQRRGTRKPHDARGEKVQLDLMAFLFALSWFQTTARLRPSITLLQTFSPLRIDASDKALVVTVANHAEPGLRATSHSWYYKSLLDEYDQADEILVALKLPKKPAPTKDAAGARDFFKQLCDSNPDLNPGKVANFTDDDWKRVVNLAFETSAR